MLSRFLDRLASLPVIFVSGAAEASIIFVPCDYAVPAPPLERIAPVVRPHPALRATFSQGEKGARRHRRRRPHSFRLVTPGAMCPVWIGEGLTGGEPDEGFALDFGDGWPFEDGAGGGDSGFDDAPFGAFAGGGFGGVAPLVFVSSLFPRDTPPGGSPPCADCETPAPAPVPEPSTWVLFALGMAALGLSRKARMNMRARKA